MQKKNPVPPQVIAEERQKREEQRRKLIVQTVKLPNGATFTRLRPVSEVVQW